MNSTDKTYLDTLIEQACKQGMTVTTRDSDDYDSVRQVNNARLSTSPYAIAECRDANDFSFWFKGLDGHKVPISIRSGGHHHEAMCSNDDGIVLLAPSGEMMLDDDMRHVWLWAGNRLGDVIDFLAGYRCVMPTGGCGNVCVGGLTHGGGWGMSYRTYGATVDVLRAAEIVLPNGDIITIHASGKPGKEEYLVEGHTDIEIEPDQLFWAIRGGGGGNFGAVTRFRFETFQPGKVYTSFALQWDRDGRIPAAAFWADFCGEADEKLNSFARMTVMDTEAPFDKNNPPFVVGGIYYGTEANCRKALKPLMSAVPPKVCKIKEELLGPLGSFVRAQLYDGGLPSLLGEGADALSPQGYALQIGPPTSGGPDKTCNGVAHAHKVSSAIPISGQALEVVEQVAAYVDKYPDLEGANLYVSFHGMGGKPKRTHPNAAFPWRDRNYMLQAQAWWNPETSLTDTHHPCDWIDGFRECLSSLCDGAFINFPDVKQDPELYYGGAWGDLRKVKTAVDPCYRLEFKMGVPPN